MKLHFPWSGIQAILNELRSATDAKPLYGAATGNGLWLVGDEGVYLMSNAAISECAVCYATECDPTKLPFDTWWHVKRATFGADDGVDFIGLDEMDRLLAAPPMAGLLPAFFLVELSPKKMVTSIEWRRCDASPKGGAA